MQIVDGMVAFITGGSSGIGLGIAKACLDAGMRVAFTYRSSAHLREAMELLGAAQDRVLAIDVDVTDRAGLTHAADETVRVLGPVHFLVANAGVQLPADLSATGHNDWDRLIEVNVTGVFNTIKEFLPRMHAHGESGHILATASVVGLIVPHAGYGAYYASKFAVVGLLEALRAELSKTKIGVSIFCPGVVRSNLEKLLQDYPLAKDPFEVGRFVLEGVRRSELYLLTHGEYAPLIVQRHDALMWALSKSTPACSEMEALIESLLPDSIYAPPRSVENKG